MPFSALTSTASCVVGRCTAQLRISPHADKGQTSDKSGLALDRDVKTMDPASSTEEQKKAAAAEAGVSRVWD